MALYRLITRLSIAFLVAVAVGACGSVPQPFRRLPDASNPLLANPSGAGVGVLAPAGFDTAFAEAVAARIAAIMQAQEIPAEAVDRVGILGFTLDGNLDTLPNDTTSRGLSLEWRLLNRQGEVVERFDQTVDVSGTQLSSAFSPAVESVAADISVQVMQLVAPDLNVVIAPPPPPPWQGAAVLIRPPRGAPGEGNMALARALAGRLSREGIVPAGTRPDFILSGEVTVEPADAEFDDVSIAWIVLDGNETILGDVRLDNRVPRRQLRMSWTAIAEAVTDAALPGVLEIIAAAR